MAYNKKKYREKSKKKVEETLDKIKKGVEEIKSSEGFKRYLKAISTNHNYSFANTISIMVSLGNTRMVRGYRQWQKEFNRNVKKGEKGATILIPIHKKYKKEVENDDGEKEEKEFKKVFFKTGAVFGYEQTEGKPIALMEKLNTTFEDDNKFSEIFIENLKEIFPNQVIHFKELDSERLGGFYSPKTKEITINTLRPLESQAKTIIHEITHSQLHDIKDTDKMSKSELGEAIMKDYSRHEVEAEATAYAVCDRFGLDTSSYSFNYITGYATSIKQGEFENILDGIKKDVGKMVDKIENVVDKQITLQKKKTKNKAR